MSDKPAITEVLAGRMVSYVERIGPNVKIHTDCGRSIELEVDKQGFIQLKSVGVSIALTGIPIFSQQGQLK